jgi:hypothetical protein
MTQIYICQQYDIRLEYITIVILIFQNEIYIHYELLFRILHNIYKLLL